MASRVPLLVKSKGRKPSRLPIAPRAKPSNTPRAKRPEVQTPKNNGAEVATTSQVTKPIEKQAEAVGTAAPLAKKHAPVAKQAPPVVMISVAKPTEVKPTVTVVTGSPVARTGGISAGGSLLSSSAVAKPTVRSPVVLPVQRRPERLAKISSAGPVYRASPQTRPRNGSIGSSPGANPMKQRLMRKLDIKPHQSPRRAMQQKQQEALREPASPLVLGGKATADSEIVVPEVRLDTLQSRREITAQESTVKPTKKRPVRAKRRKISETVEVEATSPTVETTPRRRSLRRKAKRKQSYRKEDGSSGSEPDDDRDEDVDPNDLDLPEEEATNIYVPAREQATMWAKSVLQQREEDDNATEGGDNSRALVVREKKTTRSPRRRRSSSAASSIVSLIGPAGPSARSKIEELMKKEPSQMTMGELALTVPKGRRMQRHEREEAIPSADTSGSSGERTSSLLNMNALNRVRSLSVSSESAALAGSLVTPQVQIVDGQIVVMESTIKLGDERTADLIAGGDDHTGLPPRHSGSRINYAHHNTPGKRWGKEETKQFYYCLSQVGPNFSMMATLFPTRKRKELKSKFKYEEKNHAKLIEIALRASAAPLDTEMVNVISQMVDKEAERKLKAQKKKRRGRLSSVAESLNDADETASVVSSSVAASPMSSSLLTPVTHTEEFVEATNDEDLFPPTRRGSFDFSG